MTDEHSPYPLSDKKHNPDPERYAREFEVESLRKEVGNLQTEVKSLEEEAENRLKTVEDAMDEWRRTYTLGRGILVGICLALGVVGILAANLVNDLWDHLYTVNNHDGNP